MAPIKINGNALDPETDGTALRASGIESLDSSKSNYILIQTTHPLNTTQKEDLQNIGAKTLEYVSKCTYLCRWEALDLMLIYPNEQFSYITWANTYPQAFVIPARLKQTTSPNLRALAATSGSRLKHEIDVIIHNDVEASPALQLAIAEKAGVLPSTITKCENKFRLTVEEQHLDAVAAIDEVYFINEVLPDRLLNDVARRLLNADDIPVRGTGPAQYRGSGEVVAVADTGFDLGDPAATHPAFTGRVKRLYPMMRPVSDDPDGHGTHVCGSILGDGETEDGQRIQGTAPEAQLVLQSVFTRHRPDGSAELGGIPADLSRLFSPPYVNERARVHSNSWGRFDPRDYDTSAREIDNFVYTHLDMVICFAAGNDARDTTPLDGVADLGQIGS